MTAAAAAAAAVAAAAAKRRRFRRGELPGVGWDGEREKEERMLYIWSLEREWGTTARTSQTFVWDVALAI